MNNQTNWLNVILGSSNESLSEFLSGLSMIFLNHQPVTVSEMMILIKELQSALTEQSLSITHERHELSNHHYLWSLHGRQAGKLFGYLPTNKALTISGEAHLISGGIHSPSELMFSFDKQSVVSQILQVSTKQYSLNDFNIDHLSSDTLALYEAMLAAENPPCNINQKFANLFRQSLLKAGPPPTPEMQAYAERLNNQVVVQEIFIPLEGRNLRAWYYTPANRGKSRHHTVLFYIHGGGWIMGNPEFYDLQSRDICHSSGWPVLCIDYRLVPEHRFDELFDDCYDTYKWLRTADTKEFLGHSVDTIGIGGDSCGGTLAAGVTNRALDEALPVPNKLILLSPATDMMFEKHSHFNERAFNDPFLTAALAACQRSLYLPYSYWTHPYFSPVHGPLQDYPDTLIATGAQDPLAEENKLFAGKLEQTSAAKTVFLTEEGYAHDYQLFLPLSQPARRLYQQIAAFLRGEAGL